MMPYSWDYLQMASRISDRLCGEGAGREGGGGSRCNLTGRLRDVGWTWTWFGSSGCYTGLASPMGWGLEEPHFTDTIWCWMRAFVRSL